MMQKLWQKKPKLNYSKEVFDIIQFGSSVMEQAKPNDIDIAVIYSKIPLKEQLNKSQEIKRQLEKYSETPIHINSFDLYSLFDSSNFAKDNIIIYGKSIIAGESFSKKLGFNPKIQISYKLKGLEKREKVKFNYMLNGRKGEYGLLRKYNGKLLNPGLIEIYPEYENIFISKIKEFNIKFEIRKILF